MSTQPAAKHTQEPWINIEDSGFISNGKADQIVCQFWDRNEYDFDNKEANSARIVACVNACAGIADPAEAIRKVREALSGILDEFVANLHRAGYGNVTIEMIPQVKASRAALELLPKKEGE